jgi:RHS repeat-associated protein
MWRSKVTESRRSTSDSGSRTTNRLGTATGNFQYDSNGNLTKISPESLVYDAENRQTKISSASDTATYSYDGDGRRVTKTAGGNATTYVYDATGELAAEYGTVAQSADCTTCYLTTDPLGSTRVITDGNGNVVSRHDYYPFGEELATSNRTSALQYGVTDYVAQRFTGKERDAETGLDYFGARYYSGAQGRFTSPDEFIGGIGGAYEVGGSRPQQPGPLPYADITNPQSLNKYVYGLNNPLRYIDPDGHEIALAGTADDRDEEKKRIVANASNKGESGLFKTVTDKNGKTTLEIDKDKASQFRGEHSAGYNLLVGAINAKATITVQLSNFDAFTSPLDAKGNVTVNLNRSTSPLDTISPLRSPDGQRITNPFNIIAGHEILGHAYPKIIGQPSDESHARAIENILRRAQGLLLRDPNSN